MAGKKKSATTRLSRLIKRLMPNIPTTAPNFSTGLGLTQSKAQAEQNFTNTDYAFKLYNPPKNPSSQISINQASNRKMVNSCMWALRRSLLVMQPFVSFKLF